jgi:hypothetical protein
MIWDFSVNTPSKDTILILKTPISDVFCRLQTVKSIEIKKHFENQQGINHIISKFNI